MSRALYIAAGGGGDAIAATLLAHRDTPPGETPCIATYAWDRLLIDPLPGPRGITDFDNLTLHTPTVAEITSKTTPRAPAGSTLPRLAGELDARLFLLDPYNGATGMAQQITDMATHLGCTTLVLVDVGGDIVATGTEPELRSPLADTLALVASTLTSLPCHVLVTGAGLDGELTETDVIHRCQDHGAHQHPPITAAEAIPYQQLFEWHPSEVTGLLTAAATGHRGSVEIRDQGQPVHLTNISTAVNRLPASTLTKVNVFTGALKATESLDSIERSIRAVRGVTEIDYERHKAQELSTSSAYVAPTHRELTATLDGVRARGVDYVTTRRLAELLGVRGAHIDQLGTFLRSIAPSRYQPPVWLLR